MKGEKIKNGHFDPQNMDRKKHFEEKLNNIDEPEPFLEEKSVVNLNSFLTQCVFL